MIAAPGTDGHDMHAVIWDRLKADSWNEKREKKKKCILPQIEKKIYFQGKRGKAGQTCDGGKGGGDRLEYNALEYIIYPDPDLNTTDLSETDYSE